MKRAFILSLLFTPFVHAANDGSDIPECKGVTDVCMAADVTSTDKQGKTIKGYQFGEHNKDGKGLWMDCVRPLAKGDTVPGVTGVSKEAARACAKAQHKAHGNKR